MPARLVLTLALAVSAAPALRAQDVPEPFEPDAQAMAVRADIAAELQQLGPHPWAGRYERSEGMGGASLELAPRAGFLIAWESCLATTWTWGSVTEQDLRLALKPEPHASSEGERADAELVVLPVAWGQRHYLVSQDEIRDFCFSARTDGDDTTQYFLREGDEHLPTADQPRTLDGAPLCDGPGAQRGLE